jgi:hypothetical protein
VGITQRTQPLAQAIFREEHPSGNWHALSPMEKSNYYDRAQAAERTEHGEEQ